MWAITTPTSGTSVVLTLSSKQCKERKEYCRKLVHSGGRSRKEPADNCWRLIGQREVNRMNGMGLPTKKKSASKIIVSVSCVRDTTEIQYLGANTEREDEGKEQGEEAVAMHCTINIFGAYYDGRRTATVMPVISKVM